METHPVLRALLSPFALLYTLIMYFRNFLYDRKILASIQFDFPTISIGNLSYGGTGKTPHTEYIIRLLTGRYNIITLSRGYKRKTHGLQIAAPNSTVEQVGDEPLLIKKKYPHVVVAVAEERALAIPELLGANPKADVVILDDAMQHRSVEPGMNIALTTYQNPFTKDYILPMGTLREPRSGIKRADIIVVTKCPPDLSEEKRQQLIAEIKPSRNQVVLFSYLRYGSPYSVYDAKNRIQLTKDMDVLLFCGIANPCPLREYLEGQAQNCFIKEYPDHHNYDRYEIENLTEVFGNIDQPNKILITTEKDVVKLYPHVQWLVDKKLPIFVQPVEVAFFASDQQVFDREVLDYLSRLRGPREPNINYNING